MSPLVGADVQWPVLIAMAGKKRPAPVLTPEQLSALQARVTELVEQYGKPWPTKFTPAKGAKLADKLAEICHVANPLVSVEQFRNALLEMKPRQLFALKYLADKSQGITTDDVGVIIGITHARVLQWAQDPKFAYLLETLTLGFNQRVLRPLIMDVIVDGLRRRYAYDVHDKETGEVLFKAGTRIHDAVMIGYIREGKGFIGVATDVTEEKKTQTPADIRKQDRELREFLRENPELPALLDKTAESTITAIAPDGTPREGKSED